MRAMKRCDRMEKDITRQKRVTSRIEGRRQKSLGARLLAGWSAFWEHLYEDELPTECEHAPTHSDERNKPWNVALPWISKRDIALDSAV